MRDATLVTFVKTVFKLMHNDQINYSQRYRPLYWMRIMHFNPNKILNLYKQSNWCQKFDMFCFYRELRTEMTEIDKKSKEEERPLKYYFLIRYSHAIDLCMPRQGRIDAPDERINTLDKNL